MFFGQRTHYFLFLTVIEKDKLEDEHTKWENKHREWTKSKRAKEITASPVYASYNWVV